MRIDVVTLFPEVFAPLHSSIPARAQDKGALELHLHWLRRWGLGRHRQVDDTPYGGGVGMVMRPEPFFLCLDQIREGLDAPPHVIFPSPQGKPFHQSDAFRLAKKKHLVFLCGHYEGIDQRVRDALVDEELSLGDYVLSNGELSSMVIIDAVVRLLPGVIKEESYLQDSFASGLLDHPHYTKPPEYRDLRVPEVLLGGHHAKIEQWRLDSSLMRTRQRRPDLLDGTESSPSNRAGGP